VSTVELIAAIQAVYPGVNVGVSVAPGYVTVSLHPLPIDVFPERNTDEYPNGTYVNHHKGELAFLTSFRYADKDVDAALAAALAAVSGVSA